MSEAMVTDGWEVLSKFSLPSVPQNEIKAVESVLHVIDGLGLSGEQLERLRTAVSESVSNAIEHGNKYNPSLQVEIKVMANQKTVFISVSDQGAGGTIHDIEEPDLLAKLAGEQSPRGWGFFLIEKMVDRMILREEEGHNIIELYLNR